MALTHKSILAMFYRRDHSVQSLAFRYGISESYVEDVLRKKIWGRKVTAKTRRAKSRQMTLAERYGTVEIK